MKAKKDAAKAVEESIQATSSNPPSNAPPLEPHTSASQASSSLGPEAIPSIGASSSKRSKAQEKKRACLEFTDDEPLTYTPPSSRYHMSDSKRFKEEIPVFLNANKGDQAITVSLTARIRDSHQLIDQTIELHPETQAPSPHSYTRIPSRSG